MIVNNFLSLDAAEFQHPVIINGIKAVYFRNKRAMEHLSPLLDMVSLKKKLTAEAVAWVCIAVFLNYVWLII